MLPVKVVLFDIDGTLLKSGGAGMRSLSRIFAARYGINDSLADIKPHGKTDPVIIREILRSRGLVADDQDEARAVAELIPEYEQVFSEEMASAKQACLLPGVVPLLEALQQRRDVMLGLLTGNFEATARIKLARFDLNRFFSFGAYSSDTEERPQLVPIAVARAEALLGSALGLGRHVLVIGDTPRDVRCALANGATSVAVATSYFSTSLLRETGAHLAFDDFSDTSTVLEALLA
jgi:phosphoglycolate phosphatase-like HAD superfamily hydrolase